MCTHYLNLSSILITELSVKINYKMMNLGVRYQVVCNFVIDIKLIRFVSNTRININTGRNKKLE